MNIRKIIFAIIGVVVLLGTIIFVTGLNGEKEQTTQGTRTAGDIVIWMYGDSRTPFESVVADFQSASPSAAGKNIIVESFSDYETYTDALTSAFLQGTGPDIFTLNNNDTSLFEGQILGIDPARVSAIDFRKNYKGLFGDDLILETANGEDTVEFLKGIPVGYETLGIFYHKKYIKASDLESWAAINNAISKIKERQSDISPFALGNGTTVVGVSDIVTQFFMLEEITNLSELTGNKLKQTLGQYLLLGDVDGENAYNAKYAGMKSEGVNNLDAFSRSEVAAVIGYPRMIEQIKEKGFSKTFLFAEPFPYFFASKGKTLANYEYFVINRNSENTDIATDFMEYLVSDEGVESYLKAYPYYLPAKITLEADMLDNKINDSYNVVLGDFLNDDYILSSFNKGNKSVYDRELPQILDDSLHATEQSEKLFSRIQCMVSKITTLENLSVPCL